MDLYLQKGCFRTIAEMLETIDSIEYDFLLEKYRDMSFGVGMVNYQLAQIAWIHANTFSKVHMGIERFIHGEIGDLKATQEEIVATRLLRNQYYTWCCQEGFSKHEAEEKANEYARVYAENLRHKRLEDDLKTQASQDLGNVEKQEGD